MGLVAGHSTRTITPGAVGLVALSHPNHHTWCRGFGGWPLSHPGAVGLVMSTNHECDNLGYFVPEHVFLVCCFMSMCRGISNRLIYAIEINSFALEISSLQLFEIII